MGGNGKFHKWKISIHRSTSPKPQPTANQPHTPPPPPPEFLCPICGSLMSDPVVVGSGQTFDRICVDVCRDLGFTPTLPDGSAPDFSRTIPNLAFKSTIASWCSNTNSPLRLHAPDYSSVKQIVRRKEAEANRRSAFIRPSERELIDAVVGKKPEANLSYAVTEFAHRVNRFDLSSEESSSEESVVVAASPQTPLPLKTRPACLSSSSSSPENVVGPNESPMNAKPNPSYEDEEFVRRFTSSDVANREAAAVALRKVTRSDERRRISLCTPRLLAALRPLLASRHGGVRTNSAAAVVNLSLEKPNKVMILRSGIVPPLIDLLRGVGVGGFNGGGSSDGCGEELEAQEHAAGAIFSLSLEEDNKTAIGVLGALPPLMQCLRRSESERTRHDSALALYHLSLVKSNRTKLVKLGAVNTLLATLRPSTPAEGDRGLSGKALLVLCNLAAGADGRTAMLDGNAVEILVGMMRRGEFDSGSTRENCVAALYALSHGSLRFKGLAREARAAEVLRALVERGGGSERAKEKARRILIRLRDCDSGGGETVNWESILDDSGSFAGGGGRAGLNRPSAVDGGRNVTAANTTEF